MEYMFSYSFMAAGWLCILVVVFQCLGNYLKNIGFIK